jgi:RNA polymerase sigma-70 factor (ECF subfamily)
MSDTPLSLLDQLRQHPDEAGWQRLVALYTPLLHHWLRRFAIASADADDLVQETLTVLFKGLPEFQHNQQTGAFRRWLRTTLVHRVLHFLRQRRRHQGLGGAEAERILHDLEDPASDQSRQWDLEHDRHLAARLLDLIQPEFQPTTWRAFHLLALEGVTSEQAGRELGITPNAALVARCRVVQRLRQAARGLVD